MGGIYVVTADHGNAEDMVKRNKKGQPLLDKNGNIQILTSHTLQPVSSLNTFCIFVTNAYEMVVWHVSRPFVVIPFMPGNSSPLVYLIIQNHRIEHCYYHGFSLIDCLGFSLLRFQLQLVVLDWHLASSSARMFPMVGWPMSLQP